MSLDSSLLSKLSCFLSLLLICFSNVFFIVNACICVLVVEGIHFLKSISLILIDVSLKVLVVVLSLLLEVFLVLFCCLSCSSSLCFLRCLCLLILSTLLDFLFLLFCSSLLSCKLLEEVAIIEAKITKVSKVTG
jgi:hypothetical protein